MEINDATIEFDESGNPLLDQFSANGFVDCAFRIAEVSTDSKSHRLRLSASHHGALVGFVAIVTRGMRGGFDSNMELIRDHVYRPAVKFVRAGPESDQLIRVLAELYGLAAPPQRMVDIASFTGIALHQGELDMERDPVRIKLFGRDSDEEIARDEYFEAFFNLDLANGFVFWNEKDQDYREALIRGLSVI